MTTISARSVEVSLLSLLLATILLPGELAAHPHNQIPPTGRWTAQNRIPMRVNRPPRVAPDNQTKPLEVGTVPKIDPAEQVMLEVTVLDADSGQLLPHRVHIDDADGNYYPPEGHFDIEPANWNTNNVSYEPDTINDGYDWAMIPEGKFKVCVRARSSVRLKFAHGLEYPITIVNLDLADMAGKTLEKTVSLKRGINMRAREWMSADTHVHNLTPLGAIRQMPVEAIDYVNLMFIGPKHPLYRRGLLTGKPADVSTDDHIVYVSQEVRDANQGHMTLIGIKTPIQPILVYTGVEKVIRLPALPNEPLNWEVFDHLHAEGGLAYHAHYLFWPGWGSPVGAAVAARVEVADGQKTVDLSREIVFHRSGWLAVRARHERSDPDNWHHTITAAHTSPIYVTINGRLPAVKASAEYMTARLEATLQWARTKAMWSSDEYKNKAIVSFKKAKQFYQAALQRAQ